MQQKFKVGDIVVIAFKKQVGTVVDVVFDGFTNRYKVKTSYNTVHIDEKWLDFIKY